MVLCCLCVLQIEHLYGLTVFENYLYATNSDEGNLNPKTSVIRVNRFNSSDFNVVTRVDRGAALHVYHQRRQPPGTHPGWARKTPQVNFAWIIVKPTGSPGESYTKDRQLAHAIS